MNSDDMGRGRGDVVTQEQMGKPYYLRNAVNWEGVVSAYPPAGEFAEMARRMTTPEIESLQEQRFMEVMERGWRNDFYRSLWSEAGVKPADIKGLEDIEKLPTFTSDDIKVDQDQHPPFGAIHGIGRDDFADTPVKLQTSGGTTGYPRVTLFGPDDWEMQAISASRVLWVQGGRPGDIMQIPATCSLANLGWAYYQGCHQYTGILPVTTGSGNVTPSRRQLEYARQFGTNIWVSFPEYLIHLAHLAQDELDLDVRSLGTKFLMTFLGPDTDGALRAQLEELWGCPVYDQYSTHDIGAAAFECTAQDGLHLMEDAMYLEFLDVDNGRPVPSGEAGNITATVFARNIPLLIRYNLRDLGRFVSTSACECGVRFRRMDHFLGRSDDMVKLRGVNVYPMACLRAVKSDDRTTGEWICIMDRIDSDGKPREELTVQVEVRRDVADTTGLVEHLERELRVDLGVSVSAELVDDGALAEVANYRGEGKPRRLLDRRRE